MQWSVTIAEQVRALLGTPSADPPLEVDAGLRPEGRNGPLVRTLPSYEAYYAAVGAAVGDPGPAAGAPGGRRRGTRASGSC